jgi:glycosyltransferase involved in cell wall biosynthesis
VIPGDINRLTGGSIYDKQLADYLNDQGYNVEIASIPDLPYFASLIAGVVTSTRLLLRLISGKHDIVIEDGWVQPAALLFNLACRIIGKTQLVIIVHQPRWQRIKPPFALIARMVEKVSLRSAKLIVSVSGFIKNKVEQLVGNNKSIIIAPPGSEAFSRASFERVENDGACLRLLFVGNCNRLKGLEYLIRALAALRDISLELDIVGDTTCDTSYYDQMQRLAKQLNVDGRVTFHSVVSHESLGQFYSNADLFTFPSLYEGYGIVVGEAMQAGLPIVTTRVGPIDEIVREGENALIVPAADSEALAGAIRTLATDPSIRRRFGERSRNLAQQLPTWRQTCQKISAAIADIRYFE